LKDNVILQSFKYLLTRLGACLPKNWLVEIQAAVNYLKIGRWMRERQFSFPHRVRDRREVWRTVLPRLANRKVLYLEFGVARGTSIRWWSSELKNPEACFHGFDSFEGLGEEAGPWTKGQFDMQGRIPDIKDPRVRFFKGWFDHSMPNYSMPPHDVLVVNMDADLYSSTIYVLRWLRSYLKAGTLIYFDEMNHMEHEPKAFDEFVRETGLRFRPVAADVTLAYVLFECMGLEPARAPIVAQEVSSSLPVS
jgi:hypothetical protein